MENYEAIIDKLARERNITVEEMKKIISARIEAGMKDADPRAGRNGKGYPTPGRYPRRRSGCNMRWIGSKARAGKIYFGSIYEWGK